MLARSTYRILQRTIASRTILTCERSLLRGPGNGGFPCDAYQTRVLMRRQFQQKASAASADFAANLGAVWKKLFGKYLLATNTISSGVLMVIGDIVAQEIEYRNRAMTGEHYDMKRVWRMFIVGALQGPLHHYVYIWMDRVMPVPNMRNALQKILIDQLVMSPVCILLFFYSACYLEDKSVKETNEELIEKFPFIYLIDWMLWPGAQYINFRYLDSKYRVMFVNVCTALYNIFMSYMKHDFESLHMLSD